MTELGGLATNATWVLGSCSYTILQLGLHRSRLPWNSWDSSCQPPPHLVYSLRFPVSTGQSSNSGLPGLAREPWKNSRERGVPAVHTVPCSP